MKLNPKYKEAWVKALRSGEYTQTKGRLGTIQGGVESNCCLGVLCRILHLPRQKHKFMGHPSLYVIYAGNGYSFPYKAAPADILVAGEPAEMESFNYKSTCLTDLNDGGATFAEIADVIEREF